MVSELDWLFLVHLCGIIDFLIINDLFLVVFVKVLVLIKVFNLFGVVINIANLT
jgi:hypothetical protein